ncbi:hypothetical protein Tco_0305574 [Tanacetum coccineum]
MQSLSRQDQPCEQKKNVKTVQLHRKQPDVRLIGLCEPKYSPFGPGRLDRQWTGVCAPATYPVIGNEKREKMQAKKNDSYLVHL